jgi:hypothetical protein
MQAGRGARSALDSTSLKVAFAAVFIVVWRIYLTTPRDQTP